MMLLCILVKIIIVPHNFCQCASSFKRIFMLTFHKDTGNFFELWSVTTVFFLFLVLSHAFSLFPPSPEKHLFIHQAEWRSGSYFFRSTYVEPHAILSSSFVRKRHYIILQRTPCQILWHDPLSFSGRKKTMKVWKSNWSFNELHCLKMGFHSQ